MGRNWWKDLGCSSHSWGRRECSTLRILPEQCQALACSQPSYAEEQCPKQQRGACSTDRCKMSKELPKFLQELLGVRNLSILPPRAPPQQLRGSRVCPACCPPCCLPWGWYQHLGLGSALQSQAAQRDGITSGPV